MIELESYLAGEWRRGEGRRATLLNPTSEEPIATASTEGLDLAEALRFARERGGPALRALTFRQRGDQLRAAARAIHAHRDELIGLAIVNGGNTRGDAKFDVDGASGTLAAYADLAAELGDARLLAGRRRRPARARRAARRPARARPAPRRGGARQRLQLPGVGPGREGGDRAPRRHAGDVEAGHQHGARGVAAGADPGRGAGVPGGRLLVPGGERRRPARSSWPGRTCSPSPDQAPPDGSCAAGPGVLAQRRARQRRGRQPQRRRPRAGRGGGIRGEEPAHRATSCAT